MKTHNFKTRHNGHLNGNSNAKNISSKLIKRVQKRHFEYARGFAILTLASLIIQLYYLYKIQVFCTNCVESQQESDPLSSKSPSFPGLAIGSVNIRDKLLGGRSLRGLSPRIRRNHDSGATGEEIPPSQRPLLPKKVITVFGPESSGTTFLASTLAIATGMFDKHDVSTAQYKKINWRSTSKDGEWEIQHMSLPWGGQCGDIGGGNTIVESLVPEPCFRFQEFPKMDPRSAEVFRYEHQSEAFMKHHVSNFVEEDVMKQKCREEGHISAKNVGTNSDWTCGAACGHDEYDGYAMYPQRFSVNITSHIEWYLARGVDITVILSMRDRTISGASKTKEHCKIGSRAEKEDELALLLMTEALRHYGKRGSHAKLSSGGDGRERAIVVSYEGLMEMKQSYLSGIYGQLGMDSLFEPPFIDGNAKYVPNVTAADLVKFNTPKRKMRRRPNMPRGKEADGSGAVDKHNMELSETDQYYLTKGKESQIARRKKAKQKVKNHEHKPSISHLKAPPENNESLSRQAIHDHIIQLSNEKNSHSRQDIHKMEKKQLEDHQGYFKSSLGHVTKTQTEEHKNGHQSHSTREIYQHFAKNHNEEQTQPKQVVENMARRRLEEHADNFNPLSEQLTKKQAGENEQVIAERYEQDLLATPEEITGAQGAEGLEESVQEEADITNTTEINEEILQDQDGDEGVDNSTAFEQDQQEQDDAGTANLEKGNGGGDDDEERDDQVDVSGARTPEEQAAIHQLFASEGRAHENEGVTTYEKKENLWQSAADRHPSDGYGDYVADNADSVAEKRKRNIKRAKKLGEEDHRVKKHHSKEHLLPKKVITIFGLESSGTKILATTLSVATGAYSESRAERKQVEGRMMTSDGEWEIQHLSLPWGSFCAAEPDARVVEAVVPEECFRYENYPDHDQHMGGKLQWYKNAKGKENARFINHRGLLNSTEQIMCRDQLHISDQNVGDNSEWSCGAKCGEGKYSGFALYPQRFSVNVTSHIEWYLKRGVDITVILSLRDHSICMRSKLKDHCHNFELSQKEDDVAVKVMKESLETYGPHGSRLNEEFNVGGKERVIAVSYEGMMALKDVYLFDLYHQLGIDSTYVPTFKDGNKKHVQFDGKALEEEEKHASNSSEVETLHSK